MARHGRSKQPREPLSPYRRGGRKKKKEVKVVNRNARLEKQYEENRRHTASHVQADDDRERRLRDCGTVCTPSGTATEYMDVDAEDTSRGMEDRELGLVVISPDVKDDDWYYEDGFGAAGEEALMTEGDLELGTSTGGGEEPSVKETSKHSKQRRRRSANINQEQVNHANSWRTLVDRLIPFYLEYRRSVHQKHVSAFISRNIIAAFCPCRRRIEHQIVCLFFECK
jgi:hypothetical protein